MATYKHPGNKIDFTPGADVPAGQVVVIGNLVGVAESPITANRLGSLAIEGVFALPKATGSSTAIAMGVDCYFDVADDVAKTDSESGANKKAGVSVKAAADGDAEVWVKLGR